MTHLKSLHLHQFRNYKDARAEFGPKINFFLGQNGQGKTNCLEAIALLISGKSFRASYLKDLTMHKKPSFHLRAHFVKNDIEQSLEVHYSPTQKKVVHNETSYASFLPLIGVLQGVVFAGIFDELIKGSPQIRRRFLDLQNAQVDPLYIHHLSHFQKALKERNFLLRQRKTNAIEIYEDLMSKSAPYIISKRMKNLDEIEERMQSIHEELSGLRQKVSLKYSSSMLEEKSSSFSLCKMLLEKSRLKDQILGYTQHGPHKDEIGVYLEGQSAKKYASEGQIQTLTTALYLAEYERLLHKSEELPIFCVDDLGQNLDPSRLHRLLEKLENMGQVFITSPRLPSYTFKHPLKVFEIVDGEIRTL